MMQSNIQQDVVNYVTVSKNEMILVDDFALMMKGIILNLLHP